MTPGGVDKGKGRELPPNTSPVQGREQSPPGGDGDDEDGTGRGDKKKKNNYKHLIKGIYGASFVGGAMLQLFFSHCYHFITIGKHSMKKDDYLFTMMQVPPKQRMRIRPFDEKTQADAFTVSMEGLKGVCLVFRDLLLFILCLMTFLSMTSGIQARLCLSPHKPGKTGKNGFVSLQLYCTCAFNESNPFFTYSQKELKRLAKAQQAQGVPISPVEHPQPIEAPIPTSASGSHRPSGMSTPRPAGAATPAAIANPRPGSSTSNVPRPGSAVPRPGSTVPRPGSTVPRPGSAAATRKTALIGQDTTRPSVQIPGGVPSPVKTTAPLISPTNLYPSEQRGKKRDRDEVGVVVNTGLGATGNGNAGTNGVVPSKAILNAKAGVAGIRPRPIKKQRMVSFFTRLLSMTAIFLGFQLFIFS